MFVDASKLAVEKLKEVKQMERLTLDNAIKYIKEVARKNRINKEKNTIIIPNSFISSNDCADKYGQVAKWLEELKSYKDAEEQGLLVRLPDDLKKKVYRITYEYTECSNFGETKNNCENYNCNRDCDSQKRFYIVENRLEFMLFCNYYHELGKTVFLTREEAEKKLEELKNEI